MTIQTTTHRPIVTHSQQQLNPGMITRIRTTTISHETFMEIMLVSFQVMTVHVLSLSQVHRTITKAVRFSKIQDLILEQSLAKQIATMVAMLMKTLALQAQALDPVREAKFPFLGMEIATVITTIVIITTHQALLEQTPIVTLTIKQERHQQVVMSLWQILS